MDLPSSVTVVVIVEQAGRALMIEEDRRNPQGRVWYFPSGALEPSESLSDAARREVREETGYEVEAETVVAIDHGTFWHPAGLHWWRITVSARLVSSTPGQVDEPDILNVAWVEPGHFSGLRLRSGDATDLWDRARSGTGLPVIACRLSEDGTLGGFFA